MTIRLSLMIILCATPAAASPVSKVTQAARASFERMPLVQVVDQIEGICGADHTVNTRAVYCTTRDVILVSGQDMGAAQTAYLVAHLYGHAAQVQHGVADVALRTIQSRREEEPALRAMVARQVDCVAGVLFRRAGLPAADLRDWFSTDPFPQPHWGRQPLRSGSAMGIGLNNRNQWFNVGYSRGLSSCVSGEFGPDLLVRADQF